MACHEFIVADHINCLDIYWAHYLLVQGNQTGTVIGRCDQAKALRQNDVSHKQTPTLDGARRAEGREEFLEATGAPLTTLMLTARPQLALLSDFAHPIKSGILGRGSG